MITRSASKRGLNVLESAEKNVPPNKKSTYESDVKPEITSPIFNIHLHVTPTSGGDSASTSVKILPPFIHLHLKDFSRSIEKVDDSVQEPLLMSIHNLLSLASPKNTNVVLHDSTNSSDCSSVTLSGNNLDCSNIAVPNENSVSFGNKTKGKRNKVELGNSNILQDNKYDNEYNSKQTDLRKIPTRRGRPRNLDLNNSFQKALKCKEKTDVIIKDSSEKVTSKIAEGFSEDQTDKDFESTCIFTEKSKKTVNHFLHESEPSSDCEGSKNFEGIHKEVMLKKAVVVLEDIFKKSKSKNLLQSDCFERQSRNKSGATDFSTIGKMNTQQGSYSKHLEIEKLSGGIKNNKSDVDRNGELVSPIKRRLRCACLNVENCSCISEFSEVIESQETESASKSDLNKNKSANSKTSQTVHESNDEPSVCFTSSSVPHKLQENIYETPKRASENVNGRKSLSKRRKRTMSACELLKVARRSGEVYFAVYSSDVETVSSAEEDIGDYEFYKSMDIDCSPHLLEKSGKGYSNGKANTSSKTLIENASKQTNNKKSSSKNVTTEEERKFRNDNESATQSYNKQEVDKREEKQQNITKFIEGYNFSDIVRKFSKRFTKNQSSLPLSRTDGHEQQEIYSETRNVSKCDVVDEVDGLKKTLNKKENFNFSENQKVEELKECKTPEPKTKRKSLRKSDASEEHLACIGVNNEFFGMSTQKDYETKKKCDGDLEVREEEENDKKPSPVFNIPCHSDTRGRKKKKYSKEIDEESKQGNDSDECKILNQKKRRFSEKIKNCQEGEDVEGDHTNDRMILRNNVHKRGIECSGEETSKRSDLKERRIIFLKEKKVQTEEDSESPLSSDDVNQTPKTAGLKLGKKQDQGIVQLEDSESTDEECYHVVNKNNLIRIAKNDIRNTKCLYSKVEDPIQKCSQKEQKIVLENKVNERTSSKTNLMNEEKTESCSDSDRSQNSLEAGEGTSFRKQKDVLTATDKGGEALDKLPERNSIDKQESSPNHTHNATSYKAKECKLGTPARDTKQCKTIKVVGKKLEKKRIESEKDSEYSSSDSNHSEIFKKKKMNIKAAVENRLKRSSMLQFEESPRRVVYDKSSEGDSDSSCGDSDLNILKQKKMTLHKVLKNKMNNLAQKHSSKENLDLDEDDSNSTDFSSYVDTPDKKGNKSNTDDSKSSSIESDGSNVRKMSSNEQREEKRIAKKSSDRVEATKISTDKGSINRENSEVDAVNKANAIKGTKEENDLESSTLFILSSSDDKPLKLKEDKIKSSATSAKVADDTEIQKKTENERRKKNGIVGKNVGSVKAVKNNTVEEKCDEGDRMDVDNDMIANKATKEDSDSDFSVLSISSSSDGSRKLSEKEITFNEKEKTEEDTVGRYKKKVGEIKVDIKSTEHKESGEDSYSSSSDSEDSERYKNKEMSKNSAVEKKFDAGEKVNQNISDESKEDSESSDDSEKSENDEVGQNSGNLPRPYDRLLTAAQRSILEKIQMNHRETISEEDSDFSSDTSTKAEVKNTSKVLNKGVGMVNTTDKTKPEAPTSYVQLADSESSSSEDDEVVEEKRENPMVTTQIAGKATSKVDKEKINSNSSNQMQYEDNSESSDSEQSIEIVNLKPEPRRTHLRTIVENKAKRLNESQKLGRIEKEKDQDDSEDDSEDDSDSSSTDSDKLKASKNKEKKLNLALKSSAKYLSFKIRQVMQAGNQKDIKINDVSSEEDSESSSTDSDAFSTLGAKKSQTERMAEEKKEKERQQKIHTKYARKNDVQNKEDADSSTTDIDKQPGLKNKIKSSIQNLPVRNSDSSKEDEGKLVSLQENKANNYKKQSKVVDNDSESTDDSDSVSSNDNHSQKIDDMTNCLKSKVEKSEKYLSVSLRKYFQKFREKDRKKDEIKKENWQKQKIKTTKKDEESNSSSTDDFVVNNSEKQKSDNRGFQNIQKSTKYHVESASSSEKERSTSDHESSEDKTENRKDKKHKNTGKNEYADGGSLRLDGGETVERKDSSKKAIAKFESSSTRKLHILKEEKLTKLNSKYSEMDKTQTDLTQAMGKRPLKEPFGKKKKQIPPQDSNTKMKRSINEKSTSVPPKKPKIRKRKKSQSFPEGYIPLDVSSSTKFAVTPLNKVKPYQNHDAKTFKDKMFFGDRVKRFSSSGELRILKMKQKAKK